MKPGTSSPLGRFQVTPVTLWREAAGADPLKAREAIEQLCVKYRSPIYTFVRRQGFSTHDAEDLTQGFFAEFVGRERYKSADRSRGRLRTFLLSCVKNYISNQQRAQGREKRGGPNLELLPLNETSESEESLDFADYNTPQIEYERKWAATVITSTLKALRAEMAAAGQEEVFLKLRPYLAEKSNGAYPALASDLGVLEGSLRVTIMRFRQRYHELVRAEILQTVDSPDQVEEEMRYLISLFSRDRRG
jgi:DNA-directed RNA polymerase specialized sigma24 family protein